MKGLFPVNNAMVIIQILPVSLTIDSHYSINLNRIRNRPSV